MGRLAVGIIVSLWVIPITILVNRVVPDPYMDEIFHVPQAQQYCKGNFRRWDPMITTPPGLYYLSLGHVACLFPGMISLRRVSSFADVCSTAVLRSTNGVLAIICSVLLYEIIKQLRPTLDRRRAAFYALVLALYPLHWFFTYLYYTDVASLTMCLAMYLTCLKQSYWCSAFVSLPLLEDGEFSVILCLMSVLFGLHVFIIHHKFHIFQCHTFRGLLFTSSWVYAQMYLQFHLCVDASGNLVSLPLLQFGAFALVIRQTNIVWMFFVSCSGVIDRTMVYNKHSSRVDNADILLEETNQLAEEYKFVAKQGLKKRKVKSAVKAASNDCIPSKVTSSRTLDAGFLDELNSLVLASWQLKLELLSSFSPFLLVLVAFLAFVHWNGSVVLGAKEAHTVSPHFAQLLYFALVSALASAPLHFNVSQAAAAVSFCNNRPLSVLLGFIALATGLFFVHFFSIAHPYLLADNRHYPFYLWRKVINANWAMKYLLVPLYIYSWVSIITLLGKGQKRIWILVYFLASAAVLIPAPLIEFRYYTIPFYFFMLHVRIEDDKKWILMGIVYIVVNVFTMWKFLFQPFNWNHEAGTQRFIW